MIRIGVVDDHPVFRLGLIRMFERDRDLAVIWDVGSVKDLFQMLEKAPVDVVLMDLGLGPDDDALAATTEIRKRYEGVRVIVISASLDWDAASAARQAGASAYLPKDLAASDMVAAIHALSSPNFGRWAFRDLLATGTHTGGGLVSIRRRLTPREQEVLAELRRGRTNKEIALRFGVSISTVNKHVQQVLKKLHVRTRAQATAMINAEVLGRPSPIVESRR